MLIKTDLILTFYPTNLPEQANPLVGLDKLARAMTCIKGISRFGLVHVALAAIDSAA